MKVAAFTKIALVAALAVAPAALLAQNTNPVDRQTINQRKVDQQRRVGQGVRSGQLTAHETAHLEHQETGINREERGMRAQDSGHLTRQDKRVINHQQNQESRRIYRDKHNAAVR